MEFELVDPFSSRLLKLRSWLRGSYRYYLISYAQFNMTNFICIISLIDSSVTRTIAPLNDHLHEHDGDHLWLHSSVVPRIEPVSGGYKFKLHWSLGFFRLIDAKIYQRQNRFIDAKIAFTTARTIALFDLPQFNVWLHTYIISFLFKKVRDRGKA